MRYVTLAGALIICGAAWIAPQWLSPRACQLVAFAGFLVLTAGVVYRKEG